MAGETIRTEAICLKIVPWSRTSHIVTWLTPKGKVTTVVKGAMRPKSFVLGQYDLNYTCEILYYARAKGEIHALRDCVSINTREELRGDYRALALADYFRYLVGELAPLGDECSAWYALLERFLLPRVTSVATMVRFDLEVLELAGIKPDFSGYDKNAEWSSFCVENGTFSGENGRIIRIPREVAEFLNDPTEEKKVQIALDSAKVISVFYQFHLDCTPDVRRSVLGMIVNNIERK